MFRRSGVLLAAVVGLLFGSQLVAAAPGWAAGSRGAPGVRVEQCTESALRDAIAEAPADATIRFHCDGTITLTKDGGSTIEVHKPLTIDGAGHHVTISGGGQVSIFFVSFPGTFTLEHLTLADGNSQDVELLGGGAVYNVNAHLVADHVTFRHNRAFNYGGAIYDFGPYASLDVRNSTFTDNAVTCLSGGQGGGAIATDAGGPTTIQNTAFTANTATGGASGGAIEAARTYTAARAGALTIKRSTFDSNSTTITAPGFADTPEGGGAVAVFNHPIHIVDTTFRDNHARATAGLSEGGAFLLWGDRSPLSNLPFPLQPATVLRSRFSNNLADANWTYGSSVGGAVAIRGANLTMTGARITHNVAAQGGGIVNTGSLSLTRAKVAHNRASGNAGQAPPLAGGLYTIGPTTLTNDRFKANPTLNCVAAPGTLRARRVRSTPDPTCKALPPR